MSSKRKLMPEVALAREDRLMTWSSTLNIYRVNRFHLIDLEDKRKKNVVILNFDLIEQLLLRNMVEVVEEIFAYVGFESVRDCLLVCHLWKDFLSNHLFKRWAEQMVDGDRTLQELAVSEGWQKHLHIDQVDIEDYEIYRKICSRIFDLKEVWRYREPKLRRCFCDSFVLSLKFDNDELYCGLNNGCLQLWDLEWAARKKEQEVHEKGVKCLALSDRLIVTGSYDCTAKVMLRDVHWSLLHVITLHTDSVWDLRLHEDILVTGGLDGTIGMFNVEGTDMEITFLLQAHQDLVAAVDFTDTLLTAGYEDSHIGVWSLDDVHNPRPLRHLTGHNGGITGLIINLDLLASSSYDATVRLWNLDSGHCLHVFTDPVNFVRCVSFKGSSLVSGDFGGNVHVWDVQLLEGERVHVRNHRHFQAHRGHVVSVHVSARRIVSGSRDKTVLIQDFWAKMIDGARQRRTQRENKGERKWRSRFLK